MPIEYIIDMDLIRNIYFSRIWPRWNKKFVHLLEKIVVHPFRVTFYYNEEVKIRLTKREG